MSEELNQYLSAQLVTTFYAIKTMKTIAIEMIDNPDGPFDDQYLLAQLDLVVMSVDNMMNELIK
jgi:hypothetical protein